MAIPSATSAARIGMIQTAETRMRWRGTAIASGRWRRSDWSVMRRVPEETGIERRRRKHGQDHHRGEERQPGTRLRCHHRLKLNQCDDESDDEYIEHRPAPDQLDHPVQTRAIAGAVSRAAPHADQ